jgi:uncharacterized protein (DUF488 family)
MIASTVEIFTIGHSNISAEAFVALLQQQRVTAIADVRSTPYSRYTSQFNREALQATLKAAGIAYVFLGDELGARSKNPDCYAANGQVVYAKIAQTALFQAGIERVLRGAQTYRLSLMCAEREPLECHRTLLVAHALIARGAVIRHILHSGHEELHEQTLMRMDTKYRVQYEQAYGSAQVSFIDAVTEGSHNPPAEVVDLRTYALRQLEAEIAYRKPSTNAQEVEDRG